MPRAASAGTAAANTAPAIVAANLVDVRIDSKPSGATVMLVDGGKTSFLGTTPMMAALDRTRTYELVFSRKRRATLVQPLDPSRTQRVAVKLERAKRGAKAVEGVAAPKRKATRSSFASVVDAPESNDAGGEGVLMISSKPPCEIHVDGKPTGLMTPQRSLKLAAGKHKITLVNTAQNIRKTVSVKITAGKPTKVIQDLMK